MIDTDSSLHAIGAVLMQQDDDPTKAPRIIACASKTLTSAECKWSIRELEAYAIIWSILKYHDYIAYSPFTVRTDHQSLR